MPAAKLTARDLAERIGTDPKKLRTYLREHNTAKDIETGRYAFTAAQAKKIQADFPDWETKRLRVTDDVPTPDDEVVEWRMLPEEEAK